MNLVLFCLWKMQESRHLEIISLISRGGPVGKEFACNVGDLGSIPWVGKISWRREWLPTPVFWPGEFHGQRSLVGYSLWGLKDWTWLSDFAFLSFGVLCFTRSPSGYSPAGSCSGWWAWHAAHLAPSSLRLTVESSYSGLMAWCLKHPLFADNGRQHFSSTAPSLCVFSGWESALSSSFKKATHPTIVMGPSFMTSSNPNYLLKAHLQIPSC